MMPMSKHTDVFYNNFNFVLCVLALGYVGLVKATVNALSMVCLAKCAFFYESLCMCILFLTNK